MSTDHTSTDIPSRRWRPHALLAGLALAAGSSAAGAAAFTSNLLFKLEDASIWNGGPGVNESVTPRSFDANWNLGGSVGEIAELCVPFVGCAKAGAEIGARTNGRLGFSYGATINSGTFDLNVPISATFTTPTAVSGPDIGSVSLGAGFSAQLATLAPNRPFGATEIRTASLTVTGPTVQAYLDLAAELEAFAGAAICFGVCTGPSLGPIKIDMSQRLLGVNVNNDGRIDLLGQTLSANQSATALGGLVTARAQLPNLNSSSDSTQGGFVGGALTSTARSNVANVGANLAQIAANAVGLPIPLSGRLGPLGYNLLQANAGLSLDVQQTLSYTPDVFGRYVFSSNVVPTVNGVKGVSTNVVDFRFTDNVSIEPGQVANISYQPFVTLGGTVRNQTDLVLAGNVLVQALGIDVAGLTLPPLVNQGVDLAELGRISVYDASFHPTLGTIALPPISLDFANCEAEFGGGENGPIGVCASSGYLDMGADPNGDGTFSNPFDVISCSAHRFGEVPFCFQGPAGSTSAYVNTGIGRVFVNDGSALFFDPVTVGPQSNDDLQLGALGSVGFNGATPFVIPPGAPLSDFAVPEPHALALLGLALLGWHRRDARQGRRRTDRGWTAPAALGWAARPA